MTAVSDRKYMRLAIQQAKKSIPEDGRVHPKVGVIVVKNNRTLASAHRGETHGGHAEFIALEKKLESETLVGATVYTTLEPCTTRNHPKVACAKRLIERKVARVMIGMLDPNPKISGKGQRLLRDANIATELFPTDLMAEVEELNREFIRAHRTETNGKAVDPAFVRLAMGRSLDEWYRVINTIYQNRNFHRDSMSLFAHLVEIIGGLSVLASEKKVPGVSPEDFLTKALAWWMALCKKVRVKSLADLLWAKFPHVCAYCHQCPHDPDECTQIKRARLGPDWVQLQRLGRENASNRPVTLSQWQRMFSAIYPAQQTEGYGSTFARLTEELGELAESLRVFSERRGYFLSEAADVFAWLMHVQNLIDRDNETPKAERGNPLATALSIAYPDRCIDCGSGKCICPPVLENTIGRIAHEGPKSEALFNATNGNE